MSTYNLNDFTIVNFLLYCLYFNILLKLFLIFVAPIFSWPIFTGCLSSRLKPMVIKLIYLHGLLTYCDHSSCCKLTNLIIIYTYIIFCHLNCQSMAAFHHFISAIVCQILVFSAIYGLCLL